MNKVVKAIIFTDSRVKNLINDVFFLTFNLNVRRRILGLIWVTRFYVFQEGNMEVWVDALMCWEIEFECQRGRASINDFVGT